WHRSGTSDIGGTAFPIQESGQHIEVIYPHCLVDVLVRASNLESSVNQGSCRRLNLPQPLVLILQRIDVLSQSFGLGAGGGEFIFQPLDTAALALCRVVIRDGLPVIKEREPAIVHHSMREPFCHWRTALRTPLRHASGHRRHRLPRRRGGRGRARAPPASSHGLSQSPRLVRGIVAIPSQPPPAPLSPAAAAQSPERRGQRGRPRT